MNKKLIFRIGCDAGFFSEYLGMLFAITYCKIHDIEFKLFSKNANFGIDKGWTDFFNSFCDEVDDEFHIYFNRRIPYPTSKQLAKAVYKKLKFSTPIPNWFWSKFRLKQYVLQSYFKYKFNFDYYTFELWNKFYYGLNPYFTVNSLSSIVSTNSYHGDMKGLFQSIIHDTWIYNEIVNNEINTICSRLNLPAKYVGMHIRAGDKIKENTVFGIDKYFSKLDKGCSPNIFLLTDDYGIVEEIKERYPEYTIYTLCQKNERGYDNILFQKQSNDFKRQKMIELFTSIEILSTADIFVGVYNSNPDIFLDIRRNNNSFFVDR